jgi:5'-nucleotidase/UDP-sugar diphosphatase
MKQKLKLSLLVVWLCVISLYLPFHAIAKDDNKTYKITILHTNDHHGRFWKNKHGEYGMAARKTLIDKIRKEVAANGGYSLLLSGGDINTGVPESDLQDAEPDFLGMKKIGYDAMALGNHEFDNPIEVLKKQKKWAGFPFLSANVVHKKGGKPLFQSHIIKKHQGLKIAIVGFTTKDTEVIGNPEYLSGLRFLDPVVVGKKLIPKLKEKNDIVIAVTHMGHYHDGNHGGNAPGDVTLARSVEGLDVIIGGHSQNPLVEPDIQNGTLILQAHEWGKYVGRLDLEYKAGVLKMQNYRLIPINLKKKVKNAEGKSERVLIEDEIAEDADLRNFLTSYQEKGQAELQKKVGFADGVFVGDRKFVRNQETNLGNLIALAQMRKTNSDLAVMNSGGIRANLDQGIITYKDVLIVQPFANDLCTVTLSGKELKDYMQVVGNKEKGSGAFPQFAGVKLFFNQETLVNLEVQGKKVKDNKNYKLSLNSYIASGGDGYPKVSNHPNFVNTGYVDADMLKEYIEKNTPLSINKFAPSGDLVRK